MSGDIGVNVQSAQMQFDHQLRAARKRQPEQNPSAVVIARNPDHITATCEIGSESVTVRIKAPARAQTSHLLRDVAKRLAFVLERSN